MENVLFLQSEVKDPFEVYRKMRNDYPLYFDQTNKVWAVYKYADCESVLKNTAAYIPQPAPFTAESDEVKLVIQNLARLNNSPKHDASRKAALNLMNGWKKVNTPDLLHCLIGEPRRPVMVDWVNEISKKLPALTLMKGFDFSSQEADLILDELENLVKLMLPIRTTEQNAILNKSVTTIFNSISSTVSRIIDNNNDTEVWISISNLIGLFIQSYDVGRGLLCNALLQFVKESRSYRQDFIFFQQCVRETLRFDSPVHNTRRILSQSMVIQNRLIAAGADIFVVLASANRDPDYFENPDTYDISRSETPAYLTFGRGAHHCIAEHFSQQLTASVLHYLYNKYDHINLIETEIHYEPKVNVRLPTIMQLAIS